MAWIFKQSSGWLLSPTGDIYHGYSGAEPDGFNNPSMQSVPKVGPIPIGRYTIEEPVDTATHGPFAMHLTPDPANDMFGRSAFLIHGDSIEKPGTASEGCIIMARAIREAIWDSDDHELQVIA